MSGRRVPLSNNPNAANSPYRAAAGALKQKRSYANVQREEAYGQPPPAKKQMVKSNYANLKTPSRQPLVSGAESRMLTRKSTATASNNFARKLEASRGKPSQSTQLATDNETSLNNLETIRQWQRHYRKVFPKCVFYFESISEDLRVRFSKQVVALGAREEKFFSNAVTHVVTSRVIPPGVEGTENPEVASTKESHSQNTNSETINPLLLDRSSEPSTAQLELRPTRSKFTFEVPAGRKAAPVLQEVDLRRQQGRNVDVLHRARALGIKIWALEKLERMMVTMFETDTGLQAPHNHNTRANSTQSNPIMIPRSNRQADLSQLLRNERINGPSDRDPTVAVKEMVIFKGPFIYVHDIYEKQKPIMVREYAKVSNKEQGDWPQFRSVSNGRCPFVEEVDEDDRREVKRELANQHKSREREKSVAPQDRPKAEECGMQPPKVSTGTRVPANLQDVTNRRATVQHTTQPKSFEMAIPCMEAEHSSKSAQNAFVSRAGQGRKLNGEPVASGLQRSNITSAIRSQIISSTASAPGAKAGTSKEVHGLQRKVLEKNSGSAPFGQASSHRMTDFHAVVKDDLATRGAKRAIRKLELIDEDTSPTEVEAANHVDVDSIRQKVKVGEKKKMDKKDTRTGPKLGYCENCNESFQDFGEHTSSRKHRKFAENNDNWRELDQLLSRLAQPINHSYRDVVY